MRARREPRMKSYEAVINGTLDVRALSQREAIAKVKEFLQDNRIKPHESHIQVFLSRKPTITSSLDDKHDGGDWDKEAL